MERDAYAFAGAALSGLVLDLPDATNFLRAIRHAGFTENVVPFFKISIFTGLAACALSLAMTPLFGLWGLLIAPLIAESVYSSWFTVRRGFQGQPLAPRQFVFAAIRGHV